MNGKPKLCIVSPWNYPLFNPNNKTHFGGWEVRIALIAKEIAKRGQFQVNLLVGDHGQPHIEYREGVKLYSWTGRQIWGIPIQNEQTKLNQSRNKGGDKIGHWLGNRLQLWLRKLTKPPLLPGKVGPCPIETKAIEIFDEIDADLYMVPGNSQFSGEMAFYCRQRRKKYIFLAGSDIDFQPKYKTESDKCDLYGLSYQMKTYAIENAHLHLTQNEDQAALLWKGYRRQGVMIRNPIDLKLMYPRNPNASTILWVGKSDERIKRPLMILELATCLPEYCFVIIMNPTIPETYQKYAKMAQRLPNVTLIERVSFLEVERHFADAKLHINTSMFEGFPNTFLQAAKYGIPTLAAKVDPGAMLSKYGCGVSCNDDLEVLAQKVRLFMTDNDLYKKASICCEKYILTHHDKEKIIPQVENALFSIF